MTDTEKAALERRIDELCAEVEAERQRNDKMFEAAVKWMAKAAHFEAENAKLRADQVHWELGNCPSCPNVVSLQEALEQNAKLRKLGGFMLRCMKRNSDCSDCLVNGEHCEISHIEADALELGIEVD